MKRSQNLRPVGRIRDEQPRGKRGNRPITDKEADDVEEMSSPRTPVIYEIVRRLGDEEMDRPTFFLVLNGQLGVLPMVTGFFVPVLIGNVIGGTALFALIAYAQVMNEI